MTDTRHGSSEGDDAVDLNLSVPKGFVDADPHAAERHAALAKALVDLHRPLEAIGHYGKALALEPRHVDWLCNQAFLLGQVGKHAEAIEQTRTALDIDQHCVAAMYYQAVSLLQLGRGKEAAEQLTECARRRPDDPYVYNNLGLALAAGQRFGAAIAAYDRALALRPKYARALNNRGLAEISRHNYVRALSDLDAALMLEPSYQAAIVNRGLALSGAGDKNAALECYRSAFPAAQALANASSILSDMKQGAEALRCAELLYRSAPEMSQAAGTYHLISQKVAAWSDYQSRIDAIVAGVRTGRKPATPFAFLSVADSPPDQLQCARSIARPPESQEEPLWRGERYHHDRIRLAYLSSDFYDHATMYLAVGMFELHDRAKFEIHALSYGGNQRSTSIVGRLSNAFEHFENVAALSARQTAERVRELEIDVLVDLKGHTANSRLGILAHRPAPIQVHFLGYPGTLGEQFVDYLIADKHVIPPQDRTFYTENIVYLPHCYQVTDNRRTIDPVPWSRERAGLPPSGPVFCAFHQTYKLNPPLFDVWMRLLHHMPEATLWLLEDDGEAKARLSSEAAARGIKPERIVFAPRIQPAVHLARLKLADVFLDTWPVGAHTTASDALWVGVPVIALQGKGFAARVSASVARAAGLEDLICESLSEYEETVHRLCTDRARLVATRERLELGVRHSPLFDTAGFTHALESAYAHMHAIHQSGFAPRSFEIPPARDVCAAS